VSGGYVYFIEREPGDYVKIGWAKHNPFARLCELQTGSPDLLFVRAYIAGSRDDERRMHKTFESLRSRGEWFANILKLSDFLNHLSPDETQVAASRASTEEEFVAALDDCVLSGCWYPDYPVSEEIYDDSGDWRPWGDLLEKYDLVEPVE
jgi:hypothetical protein